MGDPGWGGALQNLSLDEVVLQPVAAQLLLHPWLDKASLVTWKLPSYTLSSVRVAG